MKHRRSIPEFIMLLFLPLSGISVQAQVADPNLEQVAADLYRIESAFGEHGANNACNALRLYIFLNLEVMLKGFDAWDSASEQEKQRVYSMHKDELHHQPSSSDPKYSKYAFSPIGWALSGDRCRLNDGDSVEQTARVFAYAKYLESTAGLTLVQPVEALLPRTIRKEFSVGNDTLDKTILTVNIYGGLTRENEYAYRMVERSFPEGWQLEKAAFQAKSWQGAPVNNYSKAFLVYLYVPNDTLQALVKLLEDAGFARQ